MPRWVGWEAEPLPFWPPFPGKGGLWSPDALSSGVRHIQMPARVVTEAGSGLPRLGKGHPHLRAGPWGNKYCPPSLLLPHFLLAGR